MTEPFADAEKLRASFGVYETARERGRCRTPPRCFETNPLPTLVLYGPDDHVIPRDFPERCEVAFTELRRPVRRAAGRALPPVGAGRHLLNQV